MRAMFTKLNEGGLFSTACDSSRSRPAGFPTPSPSVQAAFTQMGYHGTTIGGVELKDLVIALEVEIEAHLKVCETCSTYSFGNSVLTGGVAGAG